MEKLVIKSSLPEELEDLFKPKKADSISFGYYDEDGYLLTHPDDIKDLFKRIRMREKDACLEKQRNQPEPKARWAKEVVNLLKEHNQMKNIDIILALDKKGMPPSYRHLCQIFKSESDRKFYKEELVNNGSYFSLKTTK